MTPATTPAGRQLEGKTALVTGGNSGIGLATAQRLAAEGAHVFLTGRNQETIDAAVATIGGSATGIRADVSSVEDLATVAEAIAARGSGLDVLFANAGGGEFTPLAEISADQFSSVFLTNVGGTLFTVQAMLPLLNPGASIVLTGSTAAYNGTPAFSIYAATKAAIRSFGRTWATELIPRGIRVNTVIPGPIETPGLTGLAPAGQEQQLLDGEAARIPMGRVGRPDELAAAVLFLASGQSSFITGTELFVDGGQSDLKMPSQIAAGSSRDR
ncbi:SDR family oxidoreductase [Mycobacterium sp. NPDC050551]|uniref:SDR family oxidoreductase n=1 Tax=Mycobacterium sp. NPDC050551 TaxID=3155407 RepID=UPI003417DCC3